MKIHNTSGLMLAGVVLAILCLAHGGQRVYADSTAGSNSALMIKLATENANVIKLQNKIDDKTAAIKSTQMKLAGVSDDLNETNKDEDAAKSELKHRTRVLQKQLASLQRQSGDSVTGNVYVDFALNADSVPDLVSRASTVVKLSRANKSALADVNATKDRLDSLKNEQIIKRHALSDEKNTLVADKQSLEKLSDAAKSQVAVLNKTVKDNRAALAASQKKVVSVNVAKLSAVVSSNKDSGTGVTSNSAGNSYPWGQCTWYVKAVAPWSGNNWGNGAQWGASAAAEGFTVNHTPAVGSIVVVSAGQSFGGWSADCQYGHVAYVVAASGDTIVVHQGGMGFSSPAGPNTQTISGASSYSYIHR